MELKIQDLVESIRKEGIETANAQGEAIISQAQQKAAEILQKGEQEAKTMRETAEQEIALFKESAMRSIEQAKRDAMLAFKNAVRAEYEKLLAADVKKTLSDTGLAALIKAVVAGENVSDYTAEVAEVNDALKSALANELRNGLEIKPTKGVSAGFRLAAKDGSGYFDCSDEAVTAMLKPYFRDLVL